MTNSYTTASVKSEDGTIIGYRQLGQGPGLVVLHGTAESAQSHIELAEMLADAFTVYLPDRRGRGMSGPTGSDYTLQKEIDDLEALLHKTGAQYVFGVSSGAIITLQAALHNTAIRKVAIYEPPLFTTKAALPIAFIRQYEAALSNGNIAGAMVNAMLAAQMGPPIFSSIPYPVLRLLTKVAMRTEDRKAVRGDITMRMLAPTLRNDFTIVTDMAEKLDDFRAVPVNVLLLGGSKSPSYLKTALDVLEKVLPTVQRIEFPGLNHGGSGNQNRRGKPAIVARELRRFFSG